MTTATTQSIQAIANSLVEKCRKGEWEEAQQALYSPNAVSIEPCAMPGEDKEAHGLESIIEKGRQWQQNTEVHSMEVSDPLVADNFFAVRFTMDATCKMTNQRMQMAELAVYQVENGQIIREEFFYSMN